MLYGNQIIKEINSKKWSYYFWPALLFLIAFCYFFRTGSGLFFLQEKRSLFIFSLDYLHDFLNKPGGLLEYTGNFIAQGYFNKVYASLVVSLSVMLFYFSNKKIIKLLSGDGSFSLIPAIIPAILLLLLQTGEDHFIHYTLGYLLLDGAFLAAISAEKRGLNFPARALFPLLACLAGSFALLYPFIYLVYSLVYKKGIQKFLAPAIMILTAFVTFYAFKEFLFLQSPGHLMKYPLNIFDINELNSLRIILIAYMILFPLIGRKWKFINRDRVPVNLNRLTLIVVFSSALYYMGAHYDRFRNNDLLTERLFDEQNWEALIAQNELVPSNNEISQYYYNVALSEKGQLCDRMFSGRQDYGTKSLVLPATRENINRSFYFYYAIGLVNEAHHLAYESMVIGGISSENLKMLIKTDIINGNYKSAERNINTLRKTLHYRHWTDKYEKIINNSESVLSDPELREKINSKPRTDFFISPDDEENIDQALLTNPDNKRAFEYKIAFLLLRKDYRGVMYQVKRMKDMAYTSIPIHMEESMMIFINQKEELPYLGDLSIRSETTDRFSSFLKDLRMSKSETRPASGGAMERMWGNTFWYYFEFK